LTAPLPAAAPIGPHHCPLHSTSHPGHTKHTQHTHRCTQPAWHMHTEACTRTRAQHTQQTHTAAGGMLVRSSRHKPTQNTLTISRLPCLAATLSHPTTFMPAVNQAPYRYIPNPVRPTHQAVKLFLLLLRPWSAAAAAGGAGAAAPTAVATKPAC
jgi:hypothetical protein